MAEKSLAIGVDLGGTKVDVAQVDSSGNILNRIRGPTDVKGGPKAIIQNIVSSVKKLEDGIGKSLCVGVGMAGQIDPNNGAVKFAPNLGWKDVPIQEELKKALGIPVVVTNDVRAATWGEWLFGAGKGSNDIVCLFVGTGVGGGVVSGGKILTGHTNCAGELGHMTIALGGRKCHCGNHGCLEAIAGGWAIAQSAREAVEKDLKLGKPILDEAEGKLENITTKIIAKLAQSGDPLAIQLFDEVCFALIEGVAGLVNAYNPERFILSGGVINGMPQMVKTIEEGVRKVALKAATDKLIITIAKLKEDAGVVGAAAMANNLSEVGYNDTRNVNRVKPKDLE